MTNPLNGNLAVVAVSRVEHIINTRQPDLTVCGVKVKGRAPAADFPMNRERACAACIVGLAIHAIGNTVVES